MSPHLPAVLIVDDEPCLRSLLSQALEQDGLRALTAEDATQAVRTLQEHSDEIQLAIVDLRMPGTDGLETVRLLRQIRPDLRCCLMAGYFGDQQGEVTEAGACCAIQKPFLPSEMVRMAREVVGRGGRLLRLVRSSSEEGRLRGRARRFGTETTGAVPW